MIALAGNRKEVPAAQYFAGKSLKKRDLDDVLANNSFMIGSQELKTLGLFDPAIGQVLQNPLPLGFTGKPFFSNNLADDANAACFASRDTMIGC